MLSKKIIRDYFSFSRRDRLAVVILTVLILVLYSLPYFFGKVQEKIISHEMLLASAFDSLNQKKIIDVAEDDPGTMVYEPIRHEQKAEIFRFDPNTLDKVGWKRLGLSEKTANTIENYRNKGGRFYKPEDLQKIWGLPRGFYEKVKSHIVIASVAPKENEKTVFIKQEKTIAVININQSDSIQWESLPGIGPKLASRIISFRDKLGGFYSVDQVKETYGVHDSVYQKILPYLKLEGGVKQININIVSPEELKKHPYFKWNMVNAIVEYRKQHGKFDSIMQLKNILIFDDAFFNKVKPYLVTNN